MRFYDLHVRWTEDSQKLKELIETAELLGFAGIGFVFDDENVARVDFIKFRKGLFAEERKTKLDLVCVARLSERRSKMLKKMLNNIRELVDVILVKNSVVADSRIDIVAVERLKPGIASIMAENDMALELNINGLLRSSGRERVSVCKKLVWNIHVAKKFRIPIVLVSGSSEKWEMRSPRDLAAVSRVLGLNQKESINAIGNTPAAIVEKNRKKLSGKIKYRGVEVVG